MVETGEVEASRMRSPVRSADVVAAKLVRGQTGSTSLAC